MKTARRREPFDVCIVGSGAGGGMAAHALTAAGARVVMLEAGGEWYPTRDASMLRWPYQSPRRGAPTPEREFGEFDACDGGWELDGKGRLRLKAGGPARKLANIFHNPDLPEIEDYYEPWTYDYESLTRSGPSEHQPVAQPISQLDGEPLDLNWGPNWEDDLAGGPEQLPLDPLRAGVEEAVKAEYEQVFMMYLPRICEHCLNPSCVASCPSGAMYKREEDGIVLVDQEACRGWRMCMTGCPYKKVYFNHHTGKAEKCTLCYPRIEAGLPTVCSETCVGRIRYLGLVLYDADRVEEAASTPDEKDLLDAQLDVFLDPEDPEVQAQARRDGIAEDWIQAARRSPVWTLAMKHRIALPLHPEYRTLPMVWYVPPLSPVTSTVEGEGAEGEGEGELDGFAHQALALMALCDGVAEVAGLEVAAHEVAEVDRGDDLGAALVEGEHAAGAVALVFVDAAGEAVDDQQLVQVVG